MIARSRGVLLVVLVACSLLAGSPTGATRADAAVLGGTRRDWALQLGRPLGDRALPADIRGFGVPLLGWRPCADGTASLVVRFIDDRAVTIDGRPCAPGDRRRRAAYVLRAALRYVPRDARPRGTVRLPGERPIPAYSSAWLARTGAMSGNCAGTGWRPGLFTVNPKPLGLGEGWWVADVGMCADGPG